MASTRLYVRIKRRHETVFLLVEPSQSFASIRTRTAQILGLPEANLAIVGPDKETPYPDEALVSDHKLADDTEMYAVISKGGTLERVELLEGPSEEA